MARRWFKATLSVESIEKLQKDLLHYKDVTLQEKIQLLVQLLAEEGIPVARAKIKSLDAIYTGELINSILTQKGPAQKDRAVFFIVADSDHAAFVEFGTGIVGLEGGYPYPMPKGVSWNYASGKTIKDYFGNGQYGWFYPDRINGVWYFTQGMPSRPFMYETSMELAQKVVKVAKRVFAQ